MLNRGNPISISWDKDNFGDWIIIRDSEGKTIMRVKKFLWENTTAGFTAEMRDKIIEKTMNCYG